MHPVEKELLKQKKEFLKFLVIPLLSFLYTPLMQKGTERNVQPSMYALVKVELKSSRILLGIENY